MGGAPRDKGDVVEELDSDEEAPEQVSMSAGREVAQKLRKEERGNQRRVQAEAKKRRQRGRLDPEKQSRLRELSEEPAIIPDAELTGAVNAAPTVQEETVPEVSRSARSSGFLDASIVDLLSAKEKTLIKSSQLPQGNDKIREKRVKKRKTIKPVELNISGIKTVLLDVDRPSLANVNNAVDFKRKRLFGRRVHRSSDILKKF